MSQELKAPQQSKIHHVINLGQLGNFLATFLDPGNQNGSKRRSKICYNHLVPRNLMYASK
jgi:hypothetical protein